MPQIFAAGAADAAIPAFAMSKVTSGFIHYLVGRFQVLGPILREHVSDNFGELLPHVFVGDLTRYVVAEFVREEGGSASEYPTLRQILDELEEASARGDEVSALIAVSFLENLPRRGESGAGILALLGPGLRSQLDAIQ